MNKEIKKYIKYVINIKADIEYCPLKPLQIPSIIPKINGRYFLCDLSSFILNN